MKSLLLAATLMLATATFSHAQLSILPQAGFEQSRSSLRYNALSASAINTTNLRASLKADYRFKSGHGPFINIGTSPGPVNFSFGNEGSLLRQEAVVSNKLRLRIESGYQYTSKPIRLGKSKPTAGIKAARPASANTYPKKSCGASSYRPHCSASSTKALSKPVNKALSMRLQPSLAVAYVPAAAENYKQTTAGFDYNAGNWKTAVVPAIGFEFDKGNQRLFTITAFYTRPMGMKGETVTSYSGNKPVVTAINPKAATWGLTAGIPISIGKKQNINKQRAINVIKKEVKTTQYKRCTRSYSQWQ
jgi:hypothetical protein